MRYGIVLLLVSCLLSGCASAGLNALGNSATQSQIELSPIPVKPTSLPSDAVMPPVSSVPPVSRPPFHHPFDAVLDLNLPRLSDMQLRKICEDYCASQNGKCTPDEVMLWFVGVFGETYALFVDVPNRAYLTWITKDIVAGYTFVYGSSHQMEVYHEGSFYGLEEAYDAGYLTKENVATLYENYYSAFPHYSDAEKE